MGGGHRGDVVGVRADEHEPDEAQVRQLRDGSGEVDDAARIHAVLRFGARRVDLDHDVEGAEGAAVLSEFAR